MMERIQEFMRAVTLSTFSRLVRAIVKEVRASAEGTDVLRVKVSAVVSVARHLKLPVLDDLRIMITALFAEHGREIPEEIGWLFGGGTVSLELVVNPPASEAPLPVGQEAGLVPPPLPLPPPVVWEETPPPLVKPSTDNNFKKWCNLLDSAASRKHTPFPELKQLTHRFLFKEQRELTDEIWCNIVGAIVFMDEHRQTLFTSKDGALNVFRRMPVDILHEAIFGQDGLRLRTKLMVEEVRGPEVPGWVVGKTYFFLNALEALMKRRVLSDMETQLIRQMISKFPTQSLIDEGERIEKIRPSAIVVGEDSVIDRPDRGDGKPVNDAMGNALRQAGVIN